MFNAKHGIGRAWRHRRAARLALLLVLTSLAWPAGRDGHAQEPGVRREDNLVYFNLQQVDLRSALESISEVLGINYVLGGSVQPGQPITIVTSEGIPIEKVPDLLDSVLRTYNLTLLRTGDVFTVMQAQDVTQGLPTAAAPPKTEVYVYYLRNANAIDLANVLTQLFQGGAPPGGFTRRAEPSEALSRRLEDQQLDFEPPVEEPVQPQEVAPQIVRPQGAIQGELVGQTSIVPDETTNSLVIRTAPENYPSIEETIRKLDLRPLQVLIEVTIAEITLDKSTQFGIDFLIRSRAVFGDDDVNAEIEREDLSPAVGGLRVRVFDTDDVDATLRALAADSRVNVLSTPRILSVNNEEARILVGSEVPFVQFQRATIGEAVDRVVQFRNVGLELTVTPRINPDRYISLDLLQQASSLTADVLFDAPIITTREAETSLVVGDRETVVLGGLIEDRKEKRRSGIPILKDIPILGILFGSSSTRTIKTELVITLTPYIVGSDLELRDLRGEIESGTEFYQKELEKRRLEGRPVPGQLAPGRAPQPVPAAPDTIPLAPDTIPPAPDTIPPAAPDTAQAPLTPSPEAPAPARIQEMPGAVAPDTVVPDTLPPDTLAPDTLPRRPVPTTSDTLLTSGTGMTRETLVTSQPDMTAPDEAADVIQEALEREVTESSEQAALAESRPGGDAGEPPAEDAGTTGAGTGYRIQVLADPDSVVANGEEGRLKQLLDGRFTTYVDFIDPYYKVRLGDFATASDARAALPAIRALGYADAWVAPTAIR